MFQVQDRTVKSLICLHRKICFHFTRGVASKLEANWKQIGSKFAICFQFASNLLANQNLLPICFQFASDLLPIGLQSRICFQFASNLLPFFLAHEIFCLPFVLCSNWISLSTLQSSCYYSITNYLLSWQGKEGMPMVESRRNNMTEGSLDDFDETTMCCWIRKMIFLRWPARKKALWTMIIRCNYVSVIYFTIIRTTNHLSLSTMSLSHDVAGIFLRTKISSRRKKFASNLLPICFRFASNLLPLKSDLLAKQNLLPL